MMYNGKYHMLQYCDGTNWNAVTGNSGLVGWWKFDDGSGTSAADSSGNGNTGALHNTPTWTTSGKYGDALVFANASNNYVDIANPANFDLGATNPFSLAAWVYRTNATTEGEILARVLGGNWTVYSLWMPGNGESGCNSTCTTNCLEMDIVNTAGSNMLCKLVGGSAVTPNVWHHVVMTYDGSVTLAGLNLYVDGVLQTASQTTNNLTGSILAATDLKIGTDEPGQGDSFTGTVDDVRIYNRVLSATEILNLYNDGYENPRYNCPIPHRSLGISSTTAAARARRIRPATATPSRCTAA
jgi:hypothetical protein